MGLANNKRSFFYLFIISPLNVSSQTEISIRCFEYN